MESDWQEPLCAACLCRLTRCRTRAGRPAHLNSNRTPAQVNRAAQFPVPISQWRLLGSRNLSRGRPATFPGQFMAAAGVYGPKSHNPRGFVLAKGARIEIVCVFNAGEVEGFTNISICGICSRPEFDSHSGALRVKSTK